jgi:hypothetical protein
LRGKASSNGELSAANAEAIKLITTGTLSEVFADKVLQKTIK